MPMSEMVLRVFSIFSAKMDTDFMGKGSTAFYLNKITSAPIAVRKMIIFR